MAPHFAGHHLGRIGRILLPPTRAAGPSVKLKWTRLGSPQTELKSLKEVRSGSRIRSMTSRSWPGYLICREHVGSLRVRPARCAAISIVVLFLGVFLFYKSVTNYVNPPLDPLQNYV